MTDRLKERPARTFVFVDWLIMLGGIRTLTWATVLVTEPNGYGVSPAELKAHADKVHAIVDRIERANQAAKQVGFGGFTEYGALCSPLLVPAIQLWCGRSDDVIAQAKDFGDACAEGLKHTFNNYVQREDEFKRWADGVR